MEYAIVESGGKQYKAVVGETIDVDRLPNEAGDEVELKVLLSVAGDKVSVGTPFIPGAKVRAKVADHIKGPKILVFKYRPKKRIRSRRGHRQQYTRLLIQEIIPA